MMWIDFKKAYDMVPVQDIRRSHKVFLESMKIRRVNWQQEEKSRAEVKI